MQGMLVSRRRRVDVSHCCDWSYHKYEVRAVPTAKRWQAKQSSASGDFCAQKVRSGRHSTSASPLLSPPRHVSSRPLSTPPCIPFSQCKSCHFFLLDLKFGRSVVLKTDVPVAPLSPVPKARVSASARRFAILLLLSVAGDLLSGDRKTIQGTELPLLPSSLVLAFPSRPTSTAIALLDLRPPGFSRPPFLL
ncbi:hypothetical protein BJX65DRAFT_155744 [Aspergillus insuetus]